MRFATAALAAALLCAAGPAMAATATYASKADFLAAVGAASSNNLNSAPDVASYDFGAFTATAVADEPFMPDHFGFKDSALVGGGKSLQFVPSGETAVFTFDAPIYAFGIDIIGLGFEEMTDLSITINEVEYTLMTDFEGGWLNLAFAGFTNSAGFNTVTISASGFGPIELDNVLYVAAGVPEPATWAMMLVGFGALGATLRRRRLTAV